MATAFQLNADGFTKQALQLCGLVPLGRSPKADMLQDARDLFSVILKSLQARGVTLTQAIRRSLSLSSGTASYALATDVLDVDFPTTVQVTGDNNENWVERMTYGDYQTISNKTEQGQPTRAYVEKLSSCTVKFWPVPEKAYTWNYRAVVLLPDMDAGSTQTSLTQRWMSALVWRLAYWLSHANNLPMQKRVELKAMADQEEKAVMGQENDRADMNLILPCDPYRSY
jgi:hypothetical protein